MRFFFSKSKRKKLSLLKGTCLLDSEYYRANYGIGPYTSAEKHFLEIGWKLGFNPSPFFNTRYYLKLYNDVAQKKMNPLVHYLTNGGRELRRPSDDFDVQAYLAAHPTFSDSDKTPAEHCIITYGSFDWRAQQPHLPKVSNAAVNAFVRFFDPDYYISHNDDVAASGTDPLTHFVNHGQYEYRDPAPNFDTFYVQKFLKSALETQDSLINLLHKFDDVNSIKLQNDEAIQLDEAGATSTQSTIDNEPTLCVHVHCYYPELISEMIAGFRSLPAASTIVITTTSAADSEFIKNCLIKFRVEQQSIVRVVTNRGRDIAPFLIGCRDIWGKFDLVLHLHTKRSTHVYWGDDWRRYLLDQTLGSKQLVDKIIATFKFKPELGCLYPRNYYRIREFVAIENNKSSIRNHFRAVDLEGDATIQADYPAGSMAWYRTRSLSRLFDREITLQHFEDENHQVDLTFAHALERILPITVRKSGFQVRNYSTRFRQKLIPVDGVPSREVTEAVSASDWLRDSPRIARRAPVSYESLSSSFNRGRLDIQWILPSFSQAGAGGHMTIFRIVHYLEKFGHHQTIWFQNSVHFPNQAAAKRRIQDWYQPIGDRVHVRFLPDDVRQITGDVLIATDCWTAFPAAQVVNVKEKFYFIQDFEPSFHPMGELYMLADSTYSYGYSMLCAGKWLLNLMNARGAWARQWDLCADHNVYYPGVARTQVKNPLRIAFYARQYTPRRAVALGFAAFELLHRRGVNFHVDLFGEADLKIDYSFPHSQHGILSPQELSELYRSSDIGIVFSTTNYSLIPLEMMACGLPVVEIDNESTRAIFKKDEVYFAQPMPYSIADAITDLASNSLKRSAQRERGLNFVNDTSWERSAQSIEDAMIERLIEKGYKQAEPDRVATPAVISAMKATVFIPTYNAGPEFERVLEAVTTQVTDFKFDVLLIDSGSSDDTTSLAARYQHKNVRVEKIDKTEFQHGRTRNLGIERSAGQFVAVITQDACPSDRFWLSQLISGFDYGPRVAGVIGRHEAYPEHDPFTRRDIRDMFDNLAVLPKVLDREVGLPSYIYPGSRDWGMLMRFYSDNNSAISREVWKRHPYPEVEWGEDQLWAEEILRLGYQKAYVDSAVVYHSHSFSLGHQYSVSATEGRFWGKRFGIDLHPDVESSIASMNERDRAYALEMRISDALLKQRQLMNRATVQGRHFGYEESCR
ncbi:glycosyltransferase [Methylorubrum sp. B1-46]|uniref:rhamnosyltransferase WsaF family glycosyltransferase n=1 Tax=Methylorubrum sp. B1-46 TaxID=2897334 RepID=UPI001E4B63CF|nr:rhamnan synthesis F family protein [Methylorubrum sp. B1-46]UGB24886.1 glycosyltransferase [Methylorubrum sp. B1-46]